MKFFYVNKWEKTKNKNKFSKIKTKTNQKIIKCKRNTRKNFSWEVCEELQLRNLWKKFTKEIFERMLA